MNAAMLAKELRDHADSILPDFSLRDTSELILVLARVVEGKSLVKAFGAPGDWGYNTNIGKALAAPETEVKP